MYAPGLLRAAWCFRRPKAVAFRPVPVREWAGPPGKTAADSQRISPSTIWRNQGPKTELFFSTAKIFFSTGTAPDHNRSDAPERTVRRQPGISPSTIWRNQGPKTELFFSTAKIFFSAGTAPDHNRSDAPERTVRRQPGISPSTIWRN